MLTIYTSNHYNGLKSIDATYVFPENSISPWEQLEWMDKHLKEFQTENISIKTFSPYILNYINLLITKGELNDNNLNAVEYYWDEETNEITKFDIKVYKENTNNLILIDTRTLSDPINYIYTEYNKIKKEKEKR